jgi:hypothetical protein
MFRIKKRGLGGAVKTVGEASCYEISTVQKNTNTMAGPSANQGKSNCFGEILCVVLFLCFLHHAPLPVKL